MDIGIVRPVDIEDEMKEIVIYPRINNRGFSNLNLMRFPFNIAFARARITNRSNGVNEKPDMIVYNGRRCSAVIDKSAKKYPGPCEIMKK